MPKELVTYHYFLGLRTLTVIQNAVRMAEETSGKKLDMDHLDYDDPAVYASLATGKCEGVFQLESAGMKSFMKELKPKGLEDLIAGISLYRPGPMDFIPQYIRGKDHPDDVTYDCPQLEPILDATYGCIVYQEQVMQIVQDLGGYTLGRADLVRRAMSKKKASVMAKERQNFVYGSEEENVPGCVNKGISAEVANKIYDEMTDFARYAFNKSHAACYAVVSYQTAWLKYYYPVEFMAALMTSVIDNPGKVAEYIQTCRRMGIKILPPDINEGVSGFSVKDGCIVYGLNAIKNVGRPVIEALIQERTLSGPFTDLRSFAERMNGRDINKRTVEHFIKAGAMDGLGGTRKQLMMVYAQVLDNAAHEKKAAVSGQMSLFDLMGEEEKQEYAIHLPNVGEYPKQQVLAFEKEVLGVYVSGHPLEAYTSLLAKNATNKSTDFIPDEQTGHPSVMDGSKVVLGGLVELVTVKYTKKNQAMCFIQLEDLVGSVEIVVFPRDYERYRQLITEDARLLISGRVSAEEDKASKLICEKIVSMDDVPQDVWVQFGTMDEYNAAEKDLLGMIADNDGVDQMIIYVRADKAMKKLGARYSFTLTEGLRTALEEKFGAANVKVTGRQVDMSVSRYRN